MFSNFEKWCLNMRKNEFFTTLLVFTLSNFALDLFFTLDWTNTDCGEFHCPFCMLYLPVYWFQSTCSFAYFLKCFQVWCSVLLRPETFFLQSTRVNPIGVALSKQARHSRVTLTMHYQYVVGTLQRYQRRTRWNATKQHKKCILNAGHRSSAHVEMFCMWRLTTLMP